MRRARRHTHIVDERTRKEIHRDGRRVKRTEQRAEVAELDWNGTGMRLRSGVCVVCASELCAT